MWTLQLICRLVKKTYKLWSIKRNLQFSIIEQYFVLLDLVICTSSITCLQILLVCKSNSKTTLERPKAMIQLMTCPILLDRLNPYDHIRLCHHTLSYSQFVPTWPIIILLLLLLLKLHQKKFMIVNIFHYWIREKEETHTIRWDNLYYKFKEGFSTNLR